MHIHDGHIRYYYVCAIHIQNILKVLYINFKFFDVCFFFRNSKWIFQIQVFPPFLLFGVSGCVEFSLRTHIMWVGFIWLRIYIHTTHIDVWIKENVIHKTKWKKKFFSSFFFFSLVLGGFKHPLKLRFVTNKGDEQIILWLEICVESDNDGWHTFLVYIFSVFVVFCVSFSLWIITINNKSNGFWCVSYRLWLCVVFVIDVQMGYMGVWGETTFELWNCIDRNYFLF